MTVLGPVRAAIEADLRAGLGLDEIPRAVVGLDSGRFGGCGMRWGSRRIRA